MTIVEFLKARLAEDEAAVDVLGGFGRPEDGLPDTPLTRWDYDQMLIGPARVLREVEAKRAILHQASVWIDEEPDGTYALAMAQTCYGDVLKVLASVYADHPDYDQAWALEGEAVGG